MAINPASAASAYANANRMAQSAAPGAGEDFGQLLHKAAAGFVGTLDKSEQASLQAVTGKADLTAVTEAVTNAEMALQTVVAVRDRVISAYQDILKMPI
ncbi:MAG TPA: flagellar hook-basal body complex protein FliE [Gemmataceae bacterium]|jgi:flagellar hook-basal body complex protein FliE|nr:flagellar hook-basal body complex protein FliE [Gemmataceae bacterium]